MRRTISAAPRVSRIAGALTFATGALVLAAWTYEALGGGVEAPWIFRTNPATAVALALSGLALQLPRAPLPSRAARLRLAAGGLVAAIGAAKLANMATGAGPAIDRMLFSSQIALFERSLMAPNTAVGLVLLGAGLALSAQRRRGAVPAAQLCAAGALSMAMLGMSHEIRTPLTAIVGYADRLSRRDDLPPQARREVVRIDTAAQALLAIVNDVLDFSKLEAGRITRNPRLADARRLVAQAVGLFEQQAAAKGLRLTHQIGPATPPFLLLDEAASGRCS